MTVSGNTAAVKVSFDRPEFDSGLGNFYKWEMDFIRFIEKSGYDVPGYVTAIHAAVSRRRCCHTQTARIGVSRTAW